MLTRTLVALAIATCVGGFSAIARADGPSSPTPAPEESDPVLEAKRRYAAGTRAMQQKQYAEAALHFDAAQAAVPSGVALLGSAVAWDAAGQPQRAADAYARALEEPGMSKTQTTTARNRLDVLERSLGTLVVSGEDGIRVQLDDNVDTALPARLHGSPGTHRLTVWSKGKIVGKRDLYLRLGRPETISVPWRDDVPVVPAPIIRTVMVASEPRTDPVRVVGGGLVGAGIIGIASSVALTVSANYASGEASATNPPNGGVETFGGTLGAMAAFSWIASGVFLAGGTTLLLIPRPSRGMNVALTPGPTSFALTGTF